MIFSAVFGFSGKMALSILLFPISETPKNVPVVVEYLAFGFVNWKVQGKDKTII
jgi:hypothetical protein